MMRYIESAWWHFITCFIGAFICMIIMQSLNIALDWYGNNIPDPVSFWLAAKLAFPPSFFYGLYGVYYEWDVIRKSKQPPRKRHAHD